MIHPASASARTSLLSPPHNNPNSINFSQNVAKMKCYIHHEHNCFLDYFNDPVPDGAVIYVSNVPFQYNERQCKYTEFIGNPTGATLVAARRYQEILLC